MQLLTECLDPHVSSRSGEKELPQGEKRQNQSLEAAVQEERHSKAVEHQRTRESDKQETPEKTGEVSHHVLSSSPADAGPVLSTIRASRLRLRLLRSLSWRV